MGTSPTGTTTVPNEPEEVMVDTKNESTTKAQQQKNLIAKCNEVQDALSKADWNDMKVRHKVGRIVAEVKDAAKYGENAVTFMEKKLRRDEKTLYRYARVTELWPTAEFEKLVREKGPSGLPITWSHLEVLVDVADGRVRQGLLSKARKQCWSVRKLKAEAEKTKSSSPSSKKTAPLVALSHLARSLDALEQKMSHLSARAMPALLSKPELSDKEREALKSSWVKLEAAELVLTDLIAKVREVLERDDEPKKKRIVEHFPSGPQAPETNGAPSPESSAAPAPGKVLA
ncbi:MAG: DUF1016 family protein [Rhodocyclales bacterium GT-UBC]|nr:MAG: DUF1016 family protein [Rhodocyclales bacterium GT-UBC]